MNPPFLAIGLTCPQALHGKAEKPSFFAEARAALAARWLSASLEKLTTTL